MNSNQEFELLQRYVDGRASKEDVQQLNARLRSDADARREFMELLNLDSALAAVSESVAFDETISTSSQSSETSVARTSDTYVRRGGSVRRSVNRRHLVGFAAAACVVLLLVGTWRWRSSSQTWATVLNRVGTGEIAAGAELRSEPCRMDTGMVELVTARGARIVIEAPAEFRFESASRLRMTRGRLSADVPPSAKGLTVVTPSGEAIDLGTRFGVDVPETGPAEIHVFQGEVIAKASGADASENLYGGDAVAMNEGTSTARDLRSAAFIDVAEMSELTAGIKSGQQKRSEAALAALRNDPALIALLDFEAENQPGVFRMAQGRWPGSRAPEFVSIGDHMKLDVGGDQDWPQLTLAAWVRLDRLGAPYQSLLHTDGWARNNPGQVHWMITAQSTMRLALFGNTLAPGSDERFGFPDSQAEVLPEQGRWVHLAIVYDSEARTVRFFLNGKFDKQTRQDVAHPARLGPAQIGNWNREDRKLSGRIDELVLLGRSLSDREIEALYLAGCPYPHNARE